MEHAAYPTDFLVIRFDDPKTMQNLERAAVGMYELLATGAHPTCTDPDPTRTDRRGVP